MRRRLPLTMLLLATLLGAGGCTAMKKTMKVLKDPSIPVGELRDQPSQVALSLYASTDVNPNLYVPAEPAPAEGEEDTPYRVNLSSDNLSSLLGQLKATAQILEGELQARDKSATESASISVEESQAELKESSRIVSGGDGVARQVGQYRAEGHALEPESLPAAAGKRQASPVAVKVIQLKDDGVFLGADADALIDKPEKALGKTYVDHDEYVIKPDEFKFVRFFPVKQATHFIAVVASYHDTESVTWKAVRRIEPTGGRYPLLVSFDEHGVKIKSED